jgi:hypothetical protein
LLQLLQDLMGAALKMFGGCAGVVALGGHDVLASIVFQKLHYKVPAP